MAVANEFLVERHPYQLVEQDERRRYIYGFRAMFYLGSALISAAAGTMFFFVSESQYAGYFSLGVDVVAILFLVKLYLEHQRYASEIPRMIWLNGTINYFGLILLFVTLVPEMIHVGIAGFFLGTFAILIPLVFYFAGVFVTGPEALLQRTIHRRCHQHRE